MKLNLPALILARTLACSTGMPAAAAAQPVSAPTTAEDSAVLPTSVLYYGRVENIVRQSDGAIRQLHLSSQRYGDYVMNISDETLWIDSGTHTGSAPGGSIYLHLPQCGGDNVHAAPVFCYCSGAQYSHGCGLCPIP